MTFYITFEVDMYFFFWHRSPEEEVSGNKYLHQLGVDRAFHLEGSEDESEARRAISRLMDDCEVFKCQVASLGRNAYEGWTGL